MQLLGPLIFVINIVLQIYTVQCSQIHVHSRVKCILAFRHTMLPQKNGASFLYHFDSLKFGINFGIRGVFASKCVTFTSETPFDRPFFQASKADH